MFNRRSPVSFVREFLCVFLATTLIAAPVLALPVRQARVTSSFPAVSISSVKSLLRTWMPSLFLSPYARGAALQIPASPNLDTLRGTVPQLPNPYSVFQLSE